ncbi:hypothetical protein NGB25_12985 [Staphylococcus saprophyticus]|mgnify:CR=1 FL=1|uniref:hypothetical protein n=1 Tax=Staphylococcus saprophyticus TaxID=29385 RepID=UPI002DBC42E3|nr:hypothetical protein [Staphylococcus saprophyticus]MEB7678016.1 hypothetical protein [Staphylococcus saprophyticus]
MWKKFKKIVVDFWENYKEKRIETPIKINFANLKEIDEALYEEKVKSEVKKKIYLQYFLPISIVIIFLINSIIQYSKDLLNMIF